MMDYRAIEVHIQRARLERSALLGELIADGIVASWKFAVRLTTKVGTALQELAKPPKEYSTALPRQR